MRETSQKNAGCRHDQQFKSLAYCGFICVFLSLQIVTTVYSASVQLPDHTGLAAGHIIAQMTQPQPDEIEWCHKFDDKATMGWGAAYSWCTAAIEAYKDDLTGYSYGIFTFDTWSERLGNIYKIPTHLYDCFSTETNGKKFDQFTVPYQRHDVCISGHESIDQMGRKFETLSSHLAGRNNLSAMVKLDVEGSEWDIIHFMPTELFDKILTLDFEFHFCSEETMPKKYIEDRMSFYKVVAAVLGRLKEHFFVTSRAPDMHEWITETAGKCSGDKLVTMMSVSYVNKLASHSLLKK